MKTLYILFLSVLAAAGVWAEQEGVEDTLVVSGRAVVFFGPSNSEYLALTDQQKDAINEDLYEFLHTRIKVLPFLKSNGIQEIFTVKKNIRVEFGGSKSVTYPRNSFEPVLGLIMTDGINEPEVFLGVASRSDLITMFESYFGLQ